MRTAFFLSLFLVACAPETSLPEQALTRFAQDEAESGGSSADAETGIAEVVMAAGSDHAGHMDHAVHGETEDHAGHEGHDPHEGHADAPAPPPGEASVETTTIEEAATDERARAYFTDTVLTRHDGVEQRFYSDIMAGKTVVISFTFTTCPDACPLINAQLRKVQDEIGSRLGEDIRFVSITVDPETDTPEVLTAYRRKFRAEDEWAFYTGSPEAIGVVSQKLGNILEKEQHLTNLIIGNVTTARWRKVPSHLPPNVIAAQLLDIANDSVG